MARKKSRRTSLRKAKPAETIGNRFSCPECNHEKVVMCKINREENIGTAYCTICESKHKCKINNLSSAVDIYSDWIDHHEQI